jgi:hypothetical protein
MKKRPFPAGDGRFFVRHDSSVPGVDDFNSWDFFIAGKLMLCPNTNF